MCMFRYFVSFQCVILILFLFVNIWISKRSVIFLGMEYIPDLIVNDERFMWQINSLDLYKNGIAQMHSFSNLKAIITATKAILSIQNVCVLQFFLSLSLQYCTLAQYVVNCALKKRTHMELLRVFPDLFFLLHVQRE